jgi:hypothetical protein
MSIASAAHARLFRKQEVHRIDRGSVSQSQSLHPARISSSIRISRVLPVDRPVFTEPAAWQVAWQVAWQALMDCTDWQWTD